MVWGVFTYIFGGIAIIGPLCLCYWYWKAARKKFREFSDAHKAREANSGK